MSSANLFSYHSLSSQPDAKFSGVVSITGETTSFSYQNLSTPSKRPPPATVSQPHPIGGSGALLDPTAVLSPPNSSNKSYFNASVGAKLIALLNLVAYQQSETSYLMEKAQSAMIFQTFAVSQQNARLMADQAQEDVEKFMEQLAGGMLQMALSLSMIGMTILGMGISKILEIRDSRKQANTAQVSAPSTTVPTTPVTPNPVTGAGGVATPGIPIAPATGIAHPNAPIAPGLSNPAVGGSTAPILPSHSGIDASTGVAPPIPGQPNPGIPTAPARPNTGLPAPLPESDVGEPTAPVLSGHGDIVHIEATTDRPDSESIDTEAADAEAGEGLETPSILSRLNSDMDTLDLNQQSHIQTDPTHSAIARPTTIASLSSDSIVGAQAPVAPVPRQPNAGSTTPILSGPIGSGINPSTNIAPSIPGQPNAGSTAPIATTPAQAQTIAPSASASSVPPVAGDTKEPSVDTGDSLNTPTVLSRLNSDRKGPDLASRPRIQADTIASAPESATDIARLSSTSTAASTETPTARGFIASGDDSHLPLAERPHPQAYTDGTVPSSQSGLSPLGRRIEGAPSVDSAAPLVAADSPVAPAGIARTIIDLDARAPEQMPQTPQAGPLAASPAVTLHTTSSQQPTVLSPSVNPSSPTAVTAVPGLPPTQQIHGTQTGSGLGSGTPGSVATHPLSSSPAIDAAGPPVTPPAGALPGTTAAPTTTGATTAGAGAPATTAPATGAPAGAAPQGPAPGFKQSDGIKKKEATPQRWYTQLSNFIAKGGSQAVVEMSRSINTIMTQAGVLEYLNKIGDIQKAQASAQEYERMLQTSTQLYQTAVQDVTRELQSTLDNIKQIAEQTKKMTSIATK